MFDNEINNTLELWKWEDFFKLYHLFFIDTERVSQILSKQTIWLHKDFKERKVNFEEANVSCVWYFHRTINLIYEKP